MLCLRNSTYRVTSALAEANISWAHPVDGEDVDADVVGSVLVQSIDVVTERRRTQDVAVLDHVAANSLVAHLESTHLHQAVLRHWPHNLSHSPHRYYHLSAYASNADSNFNDDLYNRLCQNDNIGFWKAWRKRFCMHNAKPTGILNGKNDDENVRNEFTNYYENVFLGQMNVGQKLCTKVKLSLY